MNSTKSQENPCVKLQRHVELPTVSVVKNPPAMQESQETWVQSLGREDPLDKGMATHSSILAWRIPMDRGVWQATVHRVAKSLVQLKQLSMHAQRHLLDNENYWNHSRDTRVHLLSMQWIDLQFRIMTEFSEYTLSDPNPREPTH